MLKCNSKPVSNLIKTNKKNIHKNTTGFYIMEDVISLLLYNLRRGSYKHAQSPRRGERV